MLMINAICATLMTIALPRAEHACKQIPTIMAASEQYDVEPTVMVSLIHWESRYRPEAVSQAGACGLTQVIPKWSNPKKTCKQLKDPKTSIFAGTKMLGDYLYSSYAKADYRIALCTYNAGYRCKKGPDRQYSESGMRYAKRVLKLAAKIKKESNIYLGNANSQEVDSCFENYK